MNNYKFRTHGIPALSAGLQAVVFELGGKWEFVGVYPGQTMRYPDRPYLFLEDMKLSESDDPNNFDSCSYQEIDLAKVTIADLVKLLTPEPEMFVNVFKDDTGRFNLLHCSNSLSDTKGCIRDHFKYQYTAKLVKVEDV